MAELHLQFDSSNPQGARRKPEEAREVITSWTRGSAPVWRSLLFPAPGQRALVLGEPGAELLTLLKASGVQVERSLSTPRAVGGRGFDFILEEISGWSSRLHRDNAAALLTEEGRWILALHGKRVVGLKGRRILSQLRRQGFGIVDRYYAHTSLWSPEVLVPLERNEPFDFFLRLTVGGGALRRAAILAAFRVLRGVGIHRGFLPNCIVVARRSS
ncbi:MAG: hypothetical protein L0170_10540 [Acidobacteria bacterium]|nr:hypothetical protein [Acidobacteriota bacterium]